MAKYGTAPRESVIPSEILASAENWRTKSYTVAIDATGVVAGNPAGTFPVGTTMKDDGAGKLILWDGTGNVEGVLEEAVNVAETESVVALFRQGTFNYPKLQALNFDAAALTSTGGTVSADGEQMTFAL